METLRATRVLSGQRRGSSRPVLCDTAAGPRLCKLRGAAQGTGPLVAEVIVAVLAEALDLRVPARAAIILDGDLPTDDRDDELADLLSASVGLNLGFVMLDGARDFVASDVPAVDPAVAAAVLWLDRLVLNLDRTRANPNLLWCKGDLWLIDHGAALRFQYDWSAVTEATPAEVGAMPAPHLFEAAARTVDWPIWDALYAARMNRAVIESAVAEVPASFLVPLLPTPGRSEPAAVAEAVRRRRAQYVAYLWKRLKAPARAVWASSLAADHRV